MTPKQLRAKNDAERCRLRTLDIANPVNEGRSRLLAWTIDYYLPLMEGKDMAGRRKAAPTQADKLLEALKFVAVGTRDDDDYQNFVRLRGNKAVAFNGQVAACHPIDEELNLCPQLGKIKSALERCGKSLIISETPANQLSIKGDKLRALVPCLTEDDLPSVEPDAKVCDIDDTIKRAFIACNDLASEKAEKVHYASLLLQADSCTSTNGSVLIQAWHGYNLPPLMSLPVVFTKAVAKQKQALTGFGFSWGPDQRPSSVTFYFENDAWMKTQCYQDEWPIAMSDTILNVQTNPAVIATGLADAVEAVRQFSNDDWIVFGDDQVQSHNEDNTGAQYIVKGLQAGKKFKGADFKLIAPHVETIDLTTFEDKAYFFGSNGIKTRGVIIGYKA